MAINPETLKKLRGRLSQDELARKSGVSRKTISRIENGEANPSSIRKLTIERLARAFDVPEGALSKPPQSTETDEAWLRGIGYRKISTHLDGNTALSFALVEDRYGIAMRRQLDLAPLAVAILAELSLKARRENLQEAVAAFQATEHALPANLQHIGAAQEEIRLALEAEKESIAERDLFGRMLQQSAAEAGYEQEAFDPAFGNPFFDFLKAKATSLNISVSQQSGDETYPMEDGLPDHTCVFHDLLDDLCGDSLWARLSLQLGYARIHDIPGHLRGPESKEQRIGWLEERYPAALREQHPFANLGELEGIEDV
jgi:transcriptional regulator with XRE-family HTH domain